MNAVLAKMNDATSNLLYDIDNVQKSVNNITAFLNDESKKVSEKQVYFLDNYNQIQSCMTILKNAAESLSDAKVKYEEMLNDSNDVENDYEDQEVDEIDYLIETINNYIDKSVALSNSLKETIATFKNEMTVKNSISHDNDNVAAANASKEKDVKTNESDQGFTHILRYNDTPFFITANNHEQLVKEINNVCNNLNENNHDIKLYAVKMTEIPLKIKTKIILDICDNS